MLKPVYDHREGTLGRPHYLHPAHYLIVEGLLSFHTETLRIAHDVRVFLAPPEELRRAWKLKRDCTRRGYTTDQVLLGARPPRARRRGVHPPAAGARRHRRELPHRPTAATRRTSTPRSSCATRCRTPTSRRSSTTRTTAPRARARASASCCCGSRATSTPATPPLLEEAVWERMSFASHLRVRQLGEFTAGTDLLRSESLALVQVILLYHLVSPRAAALAVGGRHGREEPARPTGGATARCTRAGWHEQPTWVIAFAI